MRPYAAETTASESAVIVPVPETEPAVGSFRAELDRAAALGIPRT